MLPWETRSARRLPRANRRNIVTALETLEGRQLLANSALGFSVPDLKLTGSAGSVASWGGSLGVTVDVQNVAATSMIDPLSLAPGSTSTADAPASEIDVLISPRPHSLVGAYKLGSIEASSIEQNSAEQFSASFDLPSRPAGFPKAARNIYVYFVANPTGSIVEYNNLNNLSPSVPVRMVKQNLPLLQANGLDVPSVMQPGDTIKPSISIANYGTAPTNLQGNLQVALVASVDPEFTLGSSIVALYDVGNVSSLSNTPIKSYQRSGRVNARNATMHNLTPNNNVVTINGDPVTLPTSPSVYYLGIVIDPYNKIKQLPHSGNNFQLIKVVGPNTSGLPPAGVITTGGGTSAPVFPSLPNGNSVGID